MRKKQDIQVLDIPIPDTTAYERQVLADVVSYPAAMGDIEPLVGEEFFTDEKRARVWRMLVQRYQRGEPNDMVFVFPLLDKSFQNEIVPALQDVDGTPTSFVYHANTLRNKSASRRAYLAAASFIQRAVEPGTTEPELLELTESLVRAIEGPAPLQLESTLAQKLDLVRENAKATEQAVAEGKTIRVTTGFFWMDLVLNGGMKAGQLVILSARPSVGKTTLMLQMAKNAALAGNPVQVFSLEMTSEELAEKFLFSTGEVRPYQLNNGKVNWESFDRAEKDLAGLPVFLNDFSRSLDEIVSRLTQAVKRGRCKVAFIDYLGLIHDALNFGDGAKVYQVVARITGTLKNVAKRLRIPVVLLCQLNRDSVRERGKDGKPRPPELFDLRDSGSIEQDADVVLMLENLMESERRIIAWLRKNRGGKKELGFVLEPNDTYSAFNQGPVLSLDRRQATVPVPEGYTAAHTHTSVPVSAQVSEPPLSLDDAPLTTDDLPF